MSESQAFFLLSVLCDRLLPGYYSTTMYGTLLDQKVFESLVEKTMPVLWDHLVKSDVQLSVVSLPWFLSLYINSMPLVFAFRVLDCFFLEGPKVLFQIGLAILRINGEELLDVTDDGAFISVLKSYFARLDESAHPRSENSKLRAVTKFQELMVVAFKEFSGITQSTISEQRAKHKDAVLESIESFAKRTSIRNLGPESKRLSLDDLGAVYDRFYNVLYERQQRMQILEEEKIRKEKQKHKLPLLSPAVGTENGAEMGRVGLGPSPSLMDYDAFREFLAGIAKWAVTDSPTSPQKESSSEMDRPGYFTPNRNRSKSISPWGAGNPEPTDHEFMQRLFRKWDVNQSSGLTLQNVVNGLAKIKGTRDIMSTINYFFELYDEDGGGKVDREGILRMSEALLFLSRRGFEGTLTPSNSINGINDSDQGSDRVKVSTDEKFLGSVSAFIRRCFEYADPDHPQNQNGSTQGLDSNNAKLDAFTLADSDDDDEDLLDLDGKPKLNDKAPRYPVATHMGPSTSSSPPSKRDNTSANLALDPSNPLHITLPTFRMVILADELLEQFFDNFFPQSFRLSSTPTAANTSLSPTSSSNLTTFANIGARRPPAISLPSSGGIVPPGKGLRGVLDNIVTDGMRMAAEVRKKMDEAQKEMERNAIGGQHKDEDEEEDAWDEKHGGKPLDPERRSVREGDRDLLEGAEADVASMKTGRSSQSIHEQQGIEGSGASIETVAPNGGRILEFEN
jgi:TBC1 domain family member 8/9